MWTEPLDRVTDKEDELKVGQDEKQNLVGLSEDSPPNRKILAHLLERLGYKVIGCEHGQDAWNRLNSPEGKDVVAVVSDIMMPTMDGLNLLGLIREDARFKNMPVLLITATRETAPAWRR